MPENNPTSKDKPASSGNKYLRYSSMAFEMLGAIAVFGGLGYWLDHHYHSEKPWFTAGLSLLGVIGSIYYFIRKLIAEENKP